LSHRTYQLRAVFAVLMLLSGLLRAQEVSRYQIGPEPPWAEPLPLPEREEVPEHQISEGIYYLLSEEQVRVEPRETYGQFARKFLNETGVQNGSEISIGVDPAYETLELHKVEVLRDGVWQQRLTPNIISVLQRETDMERFMLDGRYTVVVRLTDVRPGDVLRYSFTLRGANPVMAGHFHHSFSAGWSEPCAHMRQRVMVPAAKRLFIRDHNTELKPRVVESGDSTLYEWEVTDMPAHIAEQNVPYWEDVFPWVEIGDMDSWQQVVDWALPLYDFDQELPPDLETEISTMQSLDSSEEKILRALRLVQDEVRYFGTETGEHSHRPRPPAVVYNQRFGDCKEKTLLLGTILRRLGLPAWPVLVNSDWGRGIEGLQPSPSAFDHVILKTKLEGRDFYLDPTRTHQRGPLSSLAIGDYGLGLIVRAGENKLTAIDPSRESAPRNEVEEIVELPAASNDSPATFKVYTKLRGESAENARERFASESRNELQEKYKRFYAETYPAIEIAKPLRHADDKKENIFEIWEEYRIPGIWLPDEKQGRMIVSFYPQEVTSYLKKPGTSGRRHSFELPHPIDVTLKTIIRLPESWSVAPSNFRETNKFFDVTYNVSRDGEAGAVISSRFRSLADHVPTSLLKDYRASVEKVLDSLGYEFTYTTKSKKADSGLLSLWPMFLAAIISFMVSLVAAVAIWWWGRLRPPPMGLYSRELEGIGGWLILVAIGLISRPFVALAGLVSIFSPYVSNPQIWQFFTEPGGRYYSAAWQPIFLFEVSFNTALIVFSVLLLVMFFSRQKTFPLTFVILLAVIVLAGLADFTMISLVPKEGLPAEMQSEMNTGLRDVARNIFAALIWIPYMLVSKRVKATFRR